MRAALTVVFYHSELLVDVDNITEINVIWFIIKVPECTLIIIKKKTTTGAWKVEEADS